MQHPARIAGLVAVSAAAAIGLWFFFTPRSPAPSEVDEAAEPPTAGRAWFAERASASGLDFVHRSGHDDRFLFPEIATGGVCLIDYDADGALDVYFVQGGTLPGGSPASTNRLFRNRGAGTFELVPASAGVGDQGYGMGCAVGDYDRDGHEDLYVTNVGANVLYRNRGDGTFEDVTQAAGVGHDGWGTSAAFLDFDGDERLDLFVVNYIYWTIAADMDCFGGEGREDYCSPNNYNNPQADVLYRGLADGRFEDISESSGIAGAFGNGLGVAVGDINDDGRPDLYVANDGMPNQLWMATGPATFENAAVLAGCAVNLMGTAEAGMGVQAEDVDQDGDLDLFLSHLARETNTLYLNEKGWFQDGTARLGLGGPSFSQTGFGLAFADFDHDGRLDVFVANGRVKRPDSKGPAADVYDEPNQLLRGIERGFEEVQPAGGTSAVLSATSRAAAIGDVNNDGAMDIVVVNKDGPAHLLINQNAGKGHWIVFRVLNRGGHYALQARVRATSVAGVMHRQVQRAYSYCASNDPRVHFGLGTVERVDEVQVLWVDGTTELFGPFDAGSVVTLQQGNGRGG